MLGMFDLFSDNIEWIKLKTRTDKSRSSNKILLELL